MIIIGVTLFSLGLTFISFIDPQTMKTSLLSLGIIMGTTGCLIIHHKTFALPAATSLGGALTLMVVFTPPSPLYIASTVIGITLGASPFHFLNPFREEKNIYLLPPYKPQ